MKHRSLAFCLAASAIPMVSASAQSAVSPPVVGDVMVSGGTLEEDKPDGVNGEPEWVKQRRFSLTRIYVQKDPWEMGVEQWYRGRTYDGGRVTQRSQTEFELGLPYRMQLDVYEKAIHDNTDDKGWQQDEVAVELRYAFADWDVIPLNPALYVEYAFAHEGSDVLESKILFGDDFGQGWHWGANLIHETQVWGDRTDEFAVSGGISKTIVDSCFSIGAEAKWSHVTDEKSEFILGPSFQWRPTANTHLDLVTLGGLTDSAPNFEGWLIFGFDFGGPSKDGGYKPTSLGGH
ncbi:MAG: hypothetical protein ABIS50_09665 [Luteolibacter sp.]|uniref:hypothetical protein n=1 Tax=Luteolibacter sp. TaxID=1962973 RepID=UPI0032665ECC